VDHNGSAARTKAPFAVKWLEPSNRRRNFRDLLYVFDACDDSPGEEDEAAAGEEETRALFSF